jgi:DNA-binding MarR family transcriptional regulator
MVGWNMQEDFLRIINEAHALNSKLFSLIRLELMANLAIFREDGITYRELKSALGLSDGVLFSNLQALQGMGYVSFSTIKLENKELQLWKITPDGLNEWKNVRKWLCKFLKSEV